MRNCCCLTRWDKRKERAASATGRRAGEKSVGVIGAFPEGEDVPAGDCARNVMRGDTAERQGGRWRCRFDEEDIQKKGSKNREKEKVKV